MDANMYEAEKKRLLDELGNEYKNQLREFVRKAFEIDTTHPTDWVSELMDLEREYLTDELLAAGRTLFNEDWPEYAPAETVRDNVRRGLEVKALFAL